MCYEIPPLIEERLDTTVSQLCSWLRTVLVLLIKGLYYVESKEQGSFYQDKLNEEWLQPVIVSFVNSLAASMYKAMI